MREPDRCHLPSTIIHLHDAVRAPELKTVVAHEDLSVEEAVHSGHPIHRDGGDAGQRIKGVDGEVGEGGIVDDCRGAEQQTDVVDAASAVVVFRLVRGIDGDPVTIRHAWNIGCGQLCVVGFGITLEAREECRPAAVAIAVAFDMTGSKTQPIKSQDGRLRLGRLSEDLELDGGQVKALKGARGRVLKLATDATAAPEVDGIVNAAENVVPEFEGEDIEKRAGHALAVRLARWNEMGEKRGEC